jgi:nicotinamidase-related amidase
MRSEGHEQTALLLIDLINPFDHEGAESLLAATRRIAPNVLRLRDAFRRQGKPVIYVNDNFGQWRSTFSQTVEHCRTQPGGDLVEMLHPAADDYFVLKPHRSGFYATPLEVLLEGLEVGELVVTGITTDMCVLATVSEAQLRKYSVTVPTDGCAAHSPERHELALRLMSTALGCKHCTVDELQSSHS